MTSPHTLILSFSASLLMPVAAQALRPLSTDRPDTTESPYTVDSGHWQIETELVAWTLHSGDLSSISLGEMNLKYGVSPHGDLQFVMPFYTRERAGDEGFGDLQIRYKHNLWGNDGSASRPLVEAMALMPYLKIPTARGTLGNGDLEGGLIVPLALDGPGDWSIGLMAQVDLLRDEDSGGYHFSPMISVAAGHDITGQTAGFLELAAMLSPEGNDEHEAYFNTGLTWAMTDRIQWDAGVRIGLTSAADDFSPFAGISMKF